MRRLGGSDCGMLLFWAAGILVALAINGLILYGAIKLVKWAWAD